MTATRTNGDTIAGQIQQHKSTDTDFSDVAHSLTDAHAHRPGLWQQDLKKANDAMHKQGLLPGVDIVGTRGQDLVTRDHAGHTQIVDSTNISRSHEDKAGSTSDVGGRHATMNPDGSGTVQAGRGDNSPWVLSQALLKSQGIENPTPNQMANYQMELEKANGKKVSQFKPGDQIKVPASTRAGDNTEFAGDRIEEKAKNDKAAVDTNYANAQKALDKWAGADTPYLQQTIPASITKADIAKGLAPDSGATPEERKGLEFLRDNYDKLADQTGGIWKKGVIFNSNITDGRQKDEAKVEQQRLLAYRD